MNQTLIAALKVVVASPTYYHRTNTPDPLKLGRLKKTGEKFTAFDHGVVDLPFWVTEDYKVAEGSGIRRIYTVKLHFPDTNIFGNQDEHFKTLEEALDNEELFVGEGYHYIFRDIESLAYDVIETKEFMDWAVAKGFEGALVNEGIGAPNNVMVFDPSKVELLEEVYTPEGLT